LQALELPAAQRAHHHEGGDEKQGGEKLGCAEFHIFSLRT